MTTTLTLPGIFGWQTLPNSWFCGALTTPGSPVPEVFSCDFAPIRDVVNLVYNWFKPITAAQQIDAALHGFLPGEQALVTGHSEGALGIWLWLRDYAPTSDVNPSSVLFVTSGAGPKIKDPQPFVTESRYRIVDVTKCWDEVADKPNVLESPFFQTAVDNAKALKVHTYGYQGLDLNGPHSERADGQVTYLFYDTPVPALTDVTHDQIETAYNRTYLR